MSFWISLVFTGFNPVTIVLIIELFVHFVRECEREIHLNARCFDVEQTTHS